MAPAIVGIDIFGGPGTNSDFGLNILGNLGDTGVTHTIYLSAGSMGTGGNEIGINCASGTVNVNNGGNITLLGIGGGVYSTNATGNSGVSCTGTVFNIGTTAGGASSTVKIEGVAGNGATTNNGITTTNLSVNFNSGTLSGNMLNLCNTIGGSTLGGVAIGGSVGGTMTICADNCVVINTVLSGPSIILEGFCTTGPGFTITGTGVLGGPATQYINVSGVSLNNTSAIVRSPAVDSSLRAAGSFKSPMAAR